MTKRGAGRGNKANFDRGLFETLCEVGMTEREITYVLKTTDKTLNKWCKREYGASFEELRDRFRATMKASIFRKQIQVAMGDGEEKPNVTMLIWLGKQFGQADKASVDIATVPTVIDNDITE